MGHFRYAMMSYSCHDLLGVKVGQFLHSSGSQRDVAWKKQAIQMSIMKIIIVYRNNWGGGWEQFQCDSWKARPNSLLLTLLLRTKSLWDRHMTPIGTAEISVSKKEIGIQGRIKIKTECTDVQVMWTHILIKSRANAPYQMLKLCIEWGCIYVTKYWP